MKAIRRRVDRLLQEYSTGRSTGVQSLPLDVYEREAVFDREIRTILMYGTAAEVAELIEIGEREMTRDGDEARADEIHDAIETRAMSDGWTGKRWRR